MKEEKLHDVNVDWDKNQPEPDTIKNNMAFPWTRLWARSIDNLIFATVLAGILDLIAPSFYDEFNALGFSIFTLFLWVFAETLLLSALGTTLGKWFLKVRIKTKDNKKPSLLTAFKRSIKVWFFGLAMGIPFIDIFTCISAYSDLTVRGVTSWDKSEQLIVTHGEIGVSRQCICWLILAIYVSLLVFIFVYPKDV
jgi:uncharacterized RDD family membrane protein YckC